MPNEIKDKFGSTTAFTITLNSMAVFTGANGQQSDMIDNSTVRAHAALIHIKITNNTGTPATANSTVDVYLLRGNKTSPDVVDDAAGASATTYPSDSSTGINAEQLGSLRNGTSPGTSDILQGTFVAEYLGPYWGIAVINRTGQIIAASGNAAYYETVNQEIQ